MPKIGFAPHELLEAHEFLAAEATGAQKLQAAMGIVQDTELRSLMQSCLSARQHRISDMEQILRTTIGTMQ